MIKGCSKKNIARKEKYNYIKYWHHLYYIQGGEKMRYNTKIIPIREFFKIIRGLVKDKNPSKRGRPKKYKDYYIISILVTMKVLNLSYRSVITFLEDYLIFLIEVS